MHNHIYKNMRVVSYKLWCSGCKAWFDVPAADVDSLRINQKTPHPSIPGLVPTTFTGCSTCGTRCILPAVGKYDRVNQAQDACRVQCVQALLPTGGEP